MSKPAPYPESSLTVWPVTRAWISNWRFDLLLGFGALWIAFGFIGFNLSTAGDDWVALSDDSILIEFALQNGRWIHAALMALQDHSRVAPTFSIAVLLASMVISSIFFARALRLHRTGSVALFIILAGCFPFWAEFASFRILHLPGATALLLSCIYGQLIWNATSDWQNGRTVASLLFKVVLAALAFSLSAATYQGFLPVGAMLLATHVVASAHDTEIKHFESCLPKLLAISIAVLSVGAALYALQVAIAQSITGIGRSPNPAYQLASSLVGNLDELADSVVRLGHYLWAFFMQPNHLFPLWPKMLFLVFLAGFLLSHLTGHLAGRPTRTAVSRRALGLCALAVLVIAPWALGLIRVPDPYRFNAIVSSGLLYAVVICFVTDRLPGKTVRTIAVTIAVAIATCFVFIQNSAALITHTNNARDTAVVNRLLERLTLAEGYQKLSRTATVNVIMNGAFATTQQRPFKTAPTAGALNTSIVECDILVCQPARLDWATRLTSSDNVVYQFVQLDDQSPSYKAALKSAFSLLPSWPAKGALQILDDTTVLLQLPTPNETRKQPDLKSEIGVLPITPSGDGFVRLTNGTGAFSVAVTNFSKQMTLTLKAESRLALPAIDVTLCQTQPETGACLSDVTKGEKGASVVLATNKPASFAIFVSSKAHLASSLFSHRIDARLVDSAGLVHGATSVAITSETASQPVDKHDKPGLSL